MAFLARESYVVRLACVKFETTKPLDKQRFCQRSSVTTPRAPPYLRGGDNTRLRLGQKGVAGKHLIQGRERYKLARQRAVVKKRGLAPSSNQTLRKYSCRDFYLIGVSVFDPRLHEVNKTVDK